MASPPIRGRGALAGSRGGSPSSGGGGTFAAAGGGGGASSGPSLARTLWNRRVPLIITHAALGGLEGREDGGAGPEEGGNVRDEEEPKKATPLFFATSVPRFGYLAQLLPRLSAFFGRPCSSFHYEDVPLRNLPVGLLVDLYRPAAGVGGRSSAAGDEDGTGPWRLVVGYGEAWHLGDTFLNGAKEADYVRYGSAKQILGLSKANTEALWHAVQDNDYAAFARVNHLLLNAPTPLKHVPLRIYIPTSAPSAGPAAPGAAATATAPGSYRMLQSLVAPRTSNRQPQTLGPVLRSLLPLLFPSSRDPVLANVILHGAPVPFHAPLEELMREAAYPDGWLCLIVVLL